MCVHKKNRIYIYIYIEDHYVNTSADFDFSLLNKILYVLYSATHILVLKDTKAETLPVLETYIKCEAAYVYRKKKRSSVLIMQPTSRFLSVLLSYSQKVLKRHSEINQMIYSLLTNSREGKEKRMKFCASYATV